MPDATFITFDGESTTLDVPEGNTLMLAAVFANIGGMEGQCGGCLSCATCHVYIDEPWASKLPPASDDEKAMLEFTASERQPSSRLSCQIEMRPELAGIVVRLPEKQS